MFIVIIFYTVIKQNLFILNWIKIYQIKANKLIKHALLQSAYVLTRIRPALHKQHKDVIDLQFLFCKLQHTGESSVGEKDTMKQEHKP